MAPRLHGEECPPDSGGFPAAIRWPKPARPELGGTWDVDARFTKAENRLAGRLVAMHRPQNQSVAISSKRSGLPGQGFRSPGSQHQREKAQENIDGAPSCS